MIKLLACVCLHTLPRRLFPFIPASISVLTTSIDIVAKKHDGGRGQAFIVFDEVASATAALRGLQGEEFYKRELVSARGRASWKAG